MGNCIKQRIENQERLQTVSFWQKKLGTAAPSPYQDAQANSGIFGCLQITHGITDEDRRGKVERITIPGLEEQSGFRFSTITIFLGGVRADECVIHSSADFHDLLQNSRMDLQCGLQRNDPPAHRRLIGNQDDFEWTLAKKAQCLQSLGKEDYVVPGANVMVAIFDNDAVTIEE